MHQFIERVSRNYMLVLGPMSVGGAIFFNLVPLYNNYKIGALTGNRKPNATLEFAVHYIYPFFNPFEHLGIATILNFWLSYVFSVSLCMLDFMLCLMVFQIYGHIQILRHNFTNFPRPKTSVVIDNLASSKDDSVVTVTSEKYDVEENEMVHKLLSNCIDHHRLILNFTDNLSSVFGFMLGVNYASHLGTCCLLLIMITSVRTTTLVTL